MAPNPALPIFGDISRPCSRTDDARPGEDSWVLAGHPLMGKLLDIEERQEAELDLMRRCLQGINELTARQCLSARQNKRGERGFGGSGQNLGSLLQQQQQQQPVPRQDQMSNKNSPGPVFISPISSGSTPLSPVSQAALPPGDEGVSNFSPQTTRGDASAFSSKMGQEMTNFSRGLGQPQSLPPTPRDVSNRMEKEHTQQTQQGTQLTANPGLLSMDSEAARALAPMINKGTDATSIRVQAIAHSINSRGKYRGPPATIRSSKTFGWITNTPSKVIWRFVEDSSSSLSAWLYAQFVTLIIIGGVTTFWTETVLPVQLMSPVVMFIEVFFAVELVVRFAVCPNRNSFWFDVYNWVDLITTVALGPIVLVTSTSTLSGPLWNLKEFCPVLLLLKLLRRFKSFHLLVSAFQVAFEALPVLLYTLLLITLAFTAILFMVEPATNVQTLPDAMWLAIVTISTVGYGDVAPITVQGKFVTTILITLGGLYTAIPIGIVGNAFSKVWEDRERLMMIQHIRNYVAWAGFTMEDLEAMFDSLDDNKDCQLSFDEFRQILPLMSVELTESTALRLFQTFDNDGEGTIDFHEFLLGVFPIQRFFYQKRIEEQHNRRQVSSSSLHSAMNIAANPSSASGGSRIAASIAAAALPNNI